MKYFDTPAFAHDLRIVLKSRKVAQLELSVQATVRRGHGVAAVQAAQHPDAGPSGLPAVVVGAVL